MKIAIVSHIHLDRDSSSTTLLEITKNMNQLGNEVDLIVPSTKKSMVGEKIIYLFSIDLNFISSVLFCLSLFFYLPIYLIKNKPSAILLDPTTVPAAIIEMFLSKLRFIKTKFILDIRSVPVDLRGIHGLLFKAQYDSSMIIAKYLCEGFTFLTEGMAKEEYNRLKIKNKPLGIWTSGVNEKLFDPKIYKEEGKRLKIKLGLENKFVVFYHGVLSSNRGLQNAVKSIDLLKKDYPNILLFFLGGGGAKDELKKIIKENNLEKNVILQDSVDYKEVPKYIAMMDVGLVPLPHHSYWNNQSPLKVMEYLAMEKPIILTDIPAHKEIIGKAKCGIFIKSHEPKEIAKGIIKAYNNKNKLKSIGKEGRKIILEKYTWGKIAKNLEKFLIKVKNGE